MINSENEYRKKERHENDHDRLALQLIPARPADFGHLDLDITDKT
jgi:hypothetical protein